MPRGGGSGGTPLDTKGIQEHISTLQDQYSIMTRSATSAEGLIQPDELASGITQEDVTNKEFEMLDKINNSSAMVLGGLYSMIKTGNAQSLNQAMAYQGKTMEDMTNLKSHMNTIANPRASRSSKIMASSALSRNFGIDAAKDYDAINRSVMGLKQLQSQFAGKLAGSAQGLQQSLLKSSAKAVKRKTFSLGNIEGVTNSIAKAIALAEKVDDKSLSASLNSAARELADIMANISDYDLGDPVKTGR